jgi:hypothetical protein
VVPTDSEKERHAFMVLDGVEGIVFLRTLLNPACGAELVTREKTKNYAEGSEPVSLAKSTSHAL